MSNTLQQMGDEVTTNVTTNGAEQNTGARVQQTLLAMLAREGQPNGYAPLNSSGSIVISTSGFLGKYLSSSILSSAALPVSDGVQANLTYLVLDPPGDWDVQSTFHYVVTSTTAYSRLIGSVSNTSGVLDATPDRFAETAVGTVTTGFNGAAPTVVTPVARFSVASITTAYAVSFSRFSASTMSCYGIIRARLMNGN